MSNADTVLLTGTVEEAMDSSTPGVQMVAISRQPHANAIVNAVVGNWPRLTGRPERNAEEDLAPLIEEGAKVTLISSGSNMMGGGLLIAREGTLLGGQFTNSGQPMLKPKGARTKGYGLKYANLVDFLEGYSAADAAALAEKAKSQLPTLRKLTQDRLNELPPYRPSGDVHVCVFGTWATPEGVTCDAIWLIGSYNKESDIVDNCVLIIRPQYGVSESGSVFGQQLLRADVGEVVGFQRMKFGDALNLANLDYDEAFESLFGSAVPA